MGTSSSKLLSQLIADRHLNTDNIGRVMRLYSSGREVIPYLQKEYTDAQLEEILIGLEDGCDVSFFDNVKLSPEQMKAIRLGVSSHSEHEVVNVPVPDEKPADEIFSEEKKESTIRDEVTLPEDQQMKEGSTTEDVDNESNGPDRKIAGRIIGFIIVAVLLLLPRFIAEKNKKDAMALVQDLNERGVVVKDGDIKYEPSSISVHSGELSLAHNKGWTSETGDADGYGYHINLSHTSTYVAAIQVAAFNNPNRVSLGSAVNLSKNQVSSMFGGVKATIGEVQDYDLNGTSAKVFNYQLSGAGESKMHRRCITAVKGKYILLINEAFEDYNSKDFEYIFGSIERSITIKSRN